MTADETRTLIEAADPQLLKLADELKDRFDAKLVWLKIGDVEIGKNPACVPAPIPAAHRHVPAGWGGR